MASGGQDGPLELFPLDPAVDELLQLSTFEANNFNIRDFMGSMSEKLIAQSKGDSGPFDPLPFIRQFETSVSKLINIRKDVQAKEEKLDKMVKTAEREYTKRTKELGRNFEAVGTSFLSLENRISEVGRTAIRIGEQLETVSRQRTRAAAAHDLIEYYNELSRGDTTRLEELRKAGREGRMKCAVLLRRLGVIAGVVDLPGAEETRDTIEKYCERFEKDMLRLFDRSYRKGDPKMMAHCAQTLLAFNGGNSCVNIYVNQHDFFISKDRIGVESVEAGSMWDTLASPDDPPPRSEPGLASLFADIRATVEQEAQIIQAVFPNPVVVMQHFLQRVFAQSIQSYIESLISKAQSVSTLAFLRVLHLARTATASLVEDLKAYDSLSAPQASSSSTSAATAASTAAAAAIAGASGSLTAMLDQALDELFVPYMEGMRYLDMESKNLTELYASYLLKFTKYHEATHKIKSSTIFDRVVNQLTAAANNPNPSSTQSSAAAAALLKLSGLTDKNASVDDIDPSDGELSVAAAERMLKWHAEAVGRCVDLSASGEVPKNSFSLLRTLAEAIGRSYVETAVDTALDKIGKYDGKAEPDLSLLSVVRPGDMVTQLWLRYASTAILPLASTAVTVRREMTLFSNHNLVRLEGKINSFVQKTTDAIISYLSLQLSKQKKTDFKPKNDEQSFARINTEPCLACCEFIGHVREAAETSLSGKNLEGFLLEIGVAFHGLLLDHLKKFPVNPTGGLMLTKDIALYQDTIARFNLPVLNTRFEMLRQLGNLFIVRPEVLRSYMREDPALGRIDPTLLRPYLFQRSDYSQFARAFDAELGVPPGADGETMSGRRRPGTLGGLLRELEHLNLNLGLGASLLDKDRKGSVVSVASSSGAGGGDAAAKEKKAGGTYASLQYVSWMP